MASTITDRVGGAVDGALVQRVGSGIVRVTGVTGTDTIVAGTSPEIGDYIDQQLFLMRPAGANVGAVTVNLEALGAKSLRSPAGSLLAGGELSGSQDVMMYFDQPTNTLRIVGPW